MAQACSCVKFLICYRNIKCFLQRDSLSSAAHVFYVCRSSRNTYRRCYRSFQTRRQIEVKKVQVPDAQQNEPSLIKPFIFTVGVCSSCFLGAMVWNYEKMRRVFRDLQRGVQPEGDKNRIRRTFGFRDHLNSSWKSLTSGQKMIFGLIASNVSIFLLWRVPSIRFLMIRYFTTAPTHPLPSMTLSSFSHISLLHMCVNMYVLWSFASVTVNFLGCEQFAAFYISAGTVSSFTSMACSRLLRRPHSVSVGASGAIMGLIGAVCLMYPNAQLSIAFVSEIFPHSFSADTGMKAVIAFDLLGLVLRWRFLDHAAHLGGMLFGLLYTQYGATLIWGNKEIVMRLWHRIRGKP